MENLSDFRSLSLYFVTFFFQSNGWASTIFFQYHLVMFYQTNEAKLLAETVIAISLRLTRKNMTLTINLSMAGQGLKWSYE